MCEEEDFVKIGMYLTEERTFSGDAVATGPLAFL